MEINKKIETLENEFKLLKGELKQTIASVRDYLSDFKLPPADEAALLAELGNEEQSVLKGDMAFHSADSPSTSEGYHKTPGTSAPDDNANPPKMNTGYPDTSTVSIGSGMAPPNFGTNASGTRQAGELLTDSHSTEPEKLFKKNLRPLDEPMKRSKADEIVDEEYLEINKEKPLMEEVNLSTPKVNLLANLIRWVSKAKRQLGDEQFATFLEVYGISGHLSLELKEVILHLVEITEAQATDENTADIWSQLILELHGILADGDAPAHTAKPLLWPDAQDEIPPAETEAAENSPEDKPIKLKLVFSNGDGTDKEFSINLSPEVSKEGTTRSFSDILKEQLKD